MKYNTFTVTLLLSLLSATMINAQSLFKDSQVIYKAYASNKSTVDQKARIFEIVAKYVWETKDSVKLTDLIIELEKNPYLFAIASGIDQQIKTSIADNMKVQALEKANLEKLLLKHDTILKQKLNADIKVNSWGKKLQDLSLASEEEQQKNRQGIIDQLNKETEIAKTFEGKLIGSQKEIAEQWEIIRAIVAKQPLLKSFTTITKQNTIASEINVTNKLQVAIDRSAGAQQQATAKISFGGVNQSSIIDGAAIFVANRIKQEVKNEFFQSFGRLMKEGKYTELNILFPQTLKLWMNIELYEYSTFLNVLRSAFKADLTRLPYNISIYLCKETNIDPQVKLLIQLVINGYENMMKGLDPMQALQEFSMTEEQIKSAPHFDIALMGFREIADGLRDNNVFDHTWISADTFMIMVNNPVHRKIFCGLVYQSMLKSMRANTEPGRLKFVEDLRLKDEYKLMQAIVQLYVEMKNIEEIYEGLRERRKHGILKSDDILPYVATVNDLVKYSINNFGVKFKGDAKIIELLDDLLLLQQACHQRDFSNAMFISYNMISAYEKDEDIPSGLKEFLRYGSFMVEVVNAQSSEDVAKAISAAALPVGSYSIKRRNFFNVSINFFPGIIGGGENIKGRARSSGTIGFTAPGGVALSWSTAKRYPESVKTALDKRKFMEKQYSKKRYFRERSVTLFFTLVDLTAPVLYRMDNTDRNEGLPENVEFAQFISPGFSMIYGLKNTSVSLLAGVQLTPKLRKFGTELKSVSRLNLGIVLDIPVFNIYTKPLKKQKTSVKSE